jgi:hypothetical protein
VLSDKPKQTKISQQPWRKAQQASDNDKKEEKVSMTYERYKKILKDEILHRQRYQESKLSIDKTKKVPAKTEWTNIVNPKIDMKLKLKMNNGFTSFKDSKKI